MCNELNYVSHRMVAMSEHLNHTISKGEWICEKGLIAFLNLQLQFVTTHSVFGLLM